MSQRSSVYFELVVDIASCIGITRSEDFSSELSLITGEAILGPVANPLLCTTNAVAGDSIPDFWGPYFPVISERFLMLLKGAGVDNIQIFPAIVKSVNDGTVWENYYVLNIIGLIKCANFTTSAYAEIFPDNFDFDVLGIDAEKAKGALLFRLQESPSTIIIHKDVGRYLMINDPEETLIGWDVKEIIQ